VEAVRFEMELEKETLNTVRYKEITDADDPPKLKVLYLQKWVAGSPPVNKIQVEIKQAPGGGE